jgi:catechol 2,3-dioxygenase-like lactoylglutathione lyase family enzyme
LEIGVTPGLIPELDVSSVDDALAFYRDTLGFAVAYERPQERLVMLTREDICLMLQQADGPGRRFRTAPLERPYGRGVNLQIQVGDVDDLYARVFWKGGMPVVPMEDHWYETDGPMRGNRQFVVADPEGYLLRFFQDLGRRPVSG